MMKVFQIFIVLLDLYDDEYDYDYDEAYEEEIPKKNKLTTQPNSQTKKNLISSTSNTKNKYISPINSTNNQTKNQQKSSPKKPTTWTDNSNEIKLDNKISNPIISNKDKKHVSDSPVFVNLNDLKYPKIDYHLSEYKEEKGSISIVIIGHVDSGKSTLMGHLLYLQGLISDKTMEKYEKESKKVGKNTFHFAWAMDESTEERKRGVTVDIAYKNFETDHKKVTAMDAPGHKDFIPNMITGTSAADAAILVIDANKNAFESGFFLGGQTKEHAVLARSLGVKHIIICVNKLEMVDWNNDRFVYIESQVRDFLNSLDYADRDLFFVPVSGLKGINLKTLDKSVTQLLWYQGKSLIELIDSLEQPIRDYQAPVRFSISDYGNTTINSLQGIGVFGKLETGVIFENEEYIILPANIKTKIRSLTVDGNKSHYLKAGQSGELLLNLDKNIAEEIRTGNLLCLPEFPVPIVMAIKAQIITLDIKYPLNIGQTLFVHSQSQKTQAKIKKIEKIFSKDGKCSRNNSVVVPKNYNAFIILELEEKICLELYSNIKQLGRVMLRASGETLAVGVVMELIG